MEENYDAVTTADCYKREKKERVSYFDAGDETM
jgi:hypothetical protein